MLLWGAVYAVLLWGAVCAVLLWGAVCAVLLWGGVCAVLLWGAVCAVLLWDAVCVAVGCSLCCVAGKAESERCVVLGECADFMNCKGEENKTVCTCNKKFVARLDRSCGT